MLYVNFFALNLNTSDVCTSKWSLFLLQVLCWDDRAFYLEQQYVRQRDDFVMAILLVKQVLVNLRPQDVVSQLEPELRESPPFPDEVTTWIKYNDLSSDSLKKTA